MTITMMVATLLRSIPTRALDDDAAADDDDDYEGDDDNCDDGDDVAFHDVAGLDDDNHHYDGDAGDARSGSEDRAAAVMMVPTLKSKLCL